MNNCRINKACSENPCGCAEPVFSIEAMPDDPSILRFNVNGKSVWYDFSPVVKTAETQTALNVNNVARTLNYLSEKSVNTIAAEELGAIMHVADIGDVDSSTIKDNGILNYQTSLDCPSGCESTANKWVSTNPIEVGTSSLSYVLGSDENGSLYSLMPPTDSSSFSYLAWGAAGKAKWAKPTIVPTPPVKDGYITRLWLDENTGEIVATREVAA